MRGRDRCRPLGIRAFYVEPVALSRLEGAPSGYRHCAADSRGIAGKNQSCAPVRPAHRASRVSELPPVPVALLGSDPVEDLESFDYGHLTISASRYVADHILLPPLGRALTQLPHRPRKYDSASKR